MSLRSVPALAAAVAGMCAATLAAPVAHAASAASATKCELTLDRVRIEPGLAATAKKPFEFRNVGTGTATCDGPVLGKKPTGPGVYSLLAGTGRGSCAGGGSGTFRIAVTFPTADGPVKLTDRGTYTFGALKGGVVGVESTGKKGVVVSSVTPTKGNCVTAPVTEMSLTSTLTLK